MAARREGHYECRHGLSYSRFSCDYQGLAAQQTVFIPPDGDVELWDVRIRNTGSEALEISVFSYVEFSFHARSTNRRRSRRPRRGPTSTRRSAASDSVGIGESLKGVEHPTPEVRRAIDAAVAWFDAVKVEGIRIERKSSPAHVFLDALLSVGRNALR